MISEIDLDRDVTKLKNRAEDRWKNILELSSPWKFFFHNCTCNVSRQSFTSKHHAWMLISFLSNTPIIKHVKKTLPITTLSKPSSCPSMLDGLFCIYNGCPFYYFRKKESEIYHHRFDISRFCKRIFTC